VANEYYYAGKPPVEHFIFKITANDTNFQLFQTGENDYDGFDANSDNIEQLRSLGFANIRISTINDYGFVYVNNAKPFLKDKAVRQALIYGLDRQKYVAAKFKGYGQVANVPASPLSWSYTEEGIAKYEYNLEKAKELLDEAGWKVGSDGIREKNGQKLQISYLTRRKDDELIPIAKENYTALGIEFNPEIMDFNAISSKLKQGNYDLASVRTDVLLDPNVAVNEFLSSFQGNYARYSNPQVDKLIVEGISTTNIEKRKAIYKELYKVFMEDPPIILLDYRKSAQAYNSRIQGLDIDNYNGISASLPKLIIQQ
jgi:peptide/nickel transport system substrate-binding protein